MDSLVYLKAGTFHVSLEIQKKPKETRLTNQTRKPTGNMLNRERWCHLKCNKHSEVVEQWCRL